MGRALLRGAASGEVEHGRQTSQHLHARAIGLVVVVADEDAIDQRADDGRELARLVAADDRVADHGDAPAVLLDDLRVQDDRWQRFMLGELGLGGGQLVALVGQQRADLGDVESFSERLDEVGDLAPDLGHALGGGIDVVRHRLTGGGTLLVVPRHDLADDVGREQLLLEAAEDALLEHLRGDAAAVGAAAGLAMQPAAPAILADDGVAAAAFAAADQARQQVLRPPLLVKGDIGVRLAPFLHLGKAGVVDDAQMLGDLFDAIGDIVRP